MYGADPRSTLILVFSSMCPVCEENWPAWRQILARVDTGRVRIAAVDLLSGAPDAYLSRHGIKPDWVIRNVEAASLTSYKFSLTPQTLGRRFAGPSGTRLDGAAQRRRSHHHRSVAR